MKQRPLRTGMQVFKSLPEGTLVQLIENMIVMEPAPMYAHQQIAGRLYRSIAAFVEKNGLGETLIAPFDVYLDAENVFQPDILFVGRDRLPLIEENGLHGAPDLVVEILSPSTAKFDMKAKKDVCERCGVQEYWIVDPETFTALGYCLAGGLFEPLDPGQGSIRSKLLREEFPF